MAMYLFIYWLSCVAPGNYPALYRFRIAPITTETGAVISPVYGQPSPCSPSDYPPLVEHLLVLPGVLAAVQPAYLDWFNSYVVESVTQTDPTGGAPRE